MSADARTVSFLALLSGLARDCGLDPSALGTVEAAALAEYLTRATTKTWRAYDWPDTILTELRSLRPEFDLGATYQIGAEVYDVDGDKYYLALQDGFSGHAIDDGAFWEEITEDFDPYVELVQAGLSPIGEALSVHDDNPATEPAAQSLGFHLTGSRLQLETAAPNRVWVRFRLPPPRFTTTPWAGGTPYHSGDLVFLPPHVYLALEEALGSGQGPTGDETRWRVQELPELLEDSVRTAAAGRWLRSEQQWEKAAAVRTIARDDLDDATAVLSDQQGQTRPYAVRTRTRNFRHFAPRRAAN